MGAITSRTRFVGTKIPPATCAEALRGATNLADFFVQLKRGKANLQEAGHYEVTKCRRDLKLGKRLGGGKFGTVFEVQDQPQVVVKFQSDCLAFAREVAMLKRLADVDVAARLRDAFVCLDEPQHKYGLVLERLEETLWQYVRDRVTEGKGGKERVWRLPSGGLWLQTKVVREWPTVARPYPL